MSGNVEFCKAINFDPSKDSESSYSASFVARFDKPFTLETELVLTDGSRWNGRVCEGKFVPDDAAGFIQACEVLSGRTV